MTANTFKQDDEYTRVIFRRWKGSGDVIAFFVDQRNPVAGLVGSYMHVGQHGDACYPHSDTQPVALDDPEVIALTRELEGAPFGYRLRPIKRYTRLREK